MESDTSKEIDARLDATRARVEQRLMEHAMETNASFEALRNEIVNMNIAMQVQFAKIDARFNSVENKFDTIQSNFDAKLDRGITHVVKWVIGLVGGAMIAFVTVITFVLNHAS
ncbi:MAG TPA: hypothetical protein VFT37_01955 [Telluria sp.]|nr:hypothetical protein [Telluria sp.]